MAPLGRVAVVFSVSGGHLAGAIKSAVHTHQYAERNECGCLEWAKVYKEMNVTCGQGLELFFYQIIPLLAGGNRTSSNASDYELMAAREQHGEEFCTNYFERVHNSYGQRVLYNTHPAFHNKAWYDASWCYVPKTCQNLNGGQEVPGTKVSWKICKKGQDVALAWLEPDSVIRGAVKHNYDLKVISGYAFYVSRGISMDEKWINKWAMTGLPIVMTPIAHTDPHRIIKGAKSWAMVRNPDYMRMDAEHLGEKWLGWDLSGGGRAVKAAEPVKVEPVKAPPVQRKRVSTSGDFLTGHGCSCLEWEKVYNSKWALCGQGAELFFAMKTNKFALDPNDSELAQAREEYSMEHCLNFFERAMNNYPVRVKYGTDPSEVGKWYDKSWCYVPSGCPNLNGGKLVPGTSIAMKFVEPNSEMDIQFVNFNPDELFKEAMTYGYDLNMLAGYSYYVPKQSMNATEAYAMKLPMLFRTSSNEMSKTLIRGPTAYALDRTMNMSVAWPGSWWSFRGPTLVTMHPKVDKVNETVLEAKAL